MEKTFFLANASLLKGVSFFKWSTIKGISTFFLLLVVCTPNAHNNQRSSVTRKILENRVSTSSSFAHNRSWVNASPGSVGKFAFFIWFGFLLFSLFVEFSLFERTIFRFSLRLAVPFSGMYPLCCLHVFWRLFI